MTNSIPTQKCILCKVSFDGYGNNPQPVKRTGRCCDTCNLSKVIPARITQLRSKF